MADKQIEMASASGASYILKIEPCTRRHCDPVPCPVLDTGLIRGKQSVLTNVFRLRIHPERTHRERIASSSTEGGLLAMTFYFRALWWVIQILVIDSQSSWESRISRPFGFSASGGLE